MDLDQKKRELMDLGRIIFDIEAISALIHEHEVKSGKKPEKILIPLPPAIEILGCKIQFGSDTDKVSILPHQETSL